MKNIFEDFKKLFTVWEFEGNIYFFNINEQTIINDTIIQSQLDVIAKLNPNKTIYSGFFKLFYKNNKAMLNFNLKDYEIKSITEADLNLIDDKGMELIYTTPK